PPSRRRDNGAAPPSPARRERAGQRGLDRPRPACQPSAGPKGGGDDGMTGSGSVALTSRSGSDGGSAAGAVAAGITGIDHTLVGVRDLEGARAAWRRLGFTISPR